MIYQTLIVSVTRLLLLGRKQSGIERRDVTRICVREKSSLFY